MTAGAGVLGTGDRVLVTRLDYLGDVVLSLPLVDAIARANPGVEIDYLTRRPAADLIAPEARFARVFALEPGAGASLRLIAALRARRYRAAVDLYSNPRSAWLCWFSGARMRVGGDRRGRRHLYTHPLRVDPSVRAATEHHLRYGAPLGAAGPAGLPELHLRADETAQAVATLAAAGVDVAGSRPVVGVHPGGKWSVKRWPAASFAELTGLLQARTGARVVVFTGPGEARHTDAVRELAGAGAVYLDAMPVREVAAIIAALDAMVACDGGVMHVSVAVGTPTVGVFGSAEPDVWFPYESQGPHVASYLPMECRPCHRHECPLGHTDCLRRLTAGRVCDDVARVLGRGGRR